MSYVKTNWINDQTPLNATNLNHIEDGIEAVPVDASVGRSSIVTKTVDIPTDVDDEGNQIHRANTVEGAFSSAFGSRNYIDAVASESVAVGGLNEDYGQDNLMFGYRCKSYANQNLTGGYRCTNKSSESIQIGEMLTIDGTITYDSKGNPKSDSKHNAQFGKNCYMGVESLNCFQSGENITQGSNGKWNAQFGYGHNIGSHNECVYVFDYRNTTENYITDSFISGYDHTVRNDGGSSDNKKYDIYFRGHNNTNRDSAGNDHSNVYEDGRGLHPENDYQHIVGSYNTGDAKAVFEVGCGDENTNDSVFYACVDDTGAQRVRYIKIGSSIITEAEAADIATQSYVGSIVGDINSALDAINGAVI